MNEVIPEPLPKCFWPETRYSPSDEPRRAMAFVLAVSPPLPGSDMMVPHQCPSHAVWNTHRRCCSQTSAYGAGASRAVSQSPERMTAGCIEATNATDGSPCASVRSISQIGLVECWTSRHMPPWSVGTTHSRYPASQSSSKSAWTSSRRRCRSPRSSANRSAMGFSLSSTSHGSAPACAFARCNAALPETIDCYAPPSAVGPQGTLAPERP